MRCPACGRMMLNKVTHFDCSNILCDYEEEIESNEVGMPEVLIRHAIPVSCVGDKAMKEVIECY